MARNNVAVKKVETIFKELDELHTAINQRAYDLFRNHEGLQPSPLADWFDAERQLVWKPAIELRQRDSQFEVLAATPGIEASDLDIRITPDDLLIKADVHHTHQAEEGAVKVCEFTDGQLFRSVHFPEKIDPEKVTAEYRNGLLHVTATIAKPTERNSVATPGDRRENPAGASTVV